MKLKVRLERNQQDHGQNSSYKEVKVLLTVVVGILIVLIGGSVFLNGRGDDKVRDAAIEEAFLHSKSRMLRDYDPILIDAVELQDITEVHRGRSSVHFKVEIAMPDLEDVYDYYFEEMIRQEVWAEEDTSGILQEIYRQAVQTSQKTVYPLGEELLLSKEERGYRVQNPEIFRMILPENPTKVIAEDFDRIMDVMNQPMEPEWGKGGDMVFDEVIGNLLDQRFFNQITFGWNRNREGTRYELTATVNEISEIPNFTNFENFRAHREEIKDRETLVSTIEGVLKEKIQRERIIRILEIREYKRPEDEQWGYGLFSRGGSTSYFRQSMGNIQNFFQMNYLSLHHLENFYRTTFPRDKEPWPKPLYTADYDGQQILARIIDGDARRKLMLEGETLWYRIYDSKSLELIEEIRIHDAVSREDVTTGEMRSSYWNEIRSRKGYDLIIFGEGRKHMFRVERSRDGLRKIELSRDYGDFSREEFYELKGRLYHIGQHGPGKDGEIQELQIVDVKKDEVVYNRSMRSMQEGYDQLSSNIFAIEKENLLLIHYGGKQDLLAEKFGEQNLQIYQGSDEGLTVHPLTEEIQQGGLINHYQIMDENRIFIESYQNTQWIIDLREKSLIAVNHSISGEAFLEAFKEEQVRDAAEGNSEMRDYVFEIYEDPRYRFTPLGEDLFFVEGFFYSGGGVLVFQREIWEVGESVSPKIRFSIKSDEGTLAYAYPDGVMILNDQEQLMVIEPDLERLKSTSLEGELSFKELTDHPAFHLLDRYREPEALRMESSYPMYGNQHFLNPNNQYRYDRETGNLFFIPAGGRESSYTLVLLRDSEIQPLLPLWDYQELSIDREFQILYYRDHNGTKVYDVEAFVEGLIQITKKQ